MAIAQVGILGAGNRIRALARLLLTAAALLAPSVASAQFGEPAPTRPPQARESLRSAQESYRRGEFEAAAQFYQAAESSKQQLTPTEQADLAAQMKANNTALQANRDGAAHLRQAEEAIRQGKLQEAGALVRSANGNQYLRSEDKARLVQLTEQLRAGGVASPVGAPTTNIVIDMSKEDYHTLLNMARTAFQRGELDAAEYYCKQAEDKASRFPTMPWNDSPAKVMRDVQAARLKQATALQPRTAPEPKQEQPSMLASGLTKVKSMFTPGAAPAAPANDPNVVAGPAVTPQQQQGQPQAVVTKETLEARMYRDKAIEAVIANDLVTAKKYAEQFKARVNPGSWWERPTPDELLRDINLHMGDVTASSTPNVGQWQQAPGTLPPVDSSNARNRLKEARVLFAQGKVEEADRLCGQIVAVKVSWGLFEDNPEKLRGDIRSVRQKSDKAESVKVLADARKLMAANNYEEARAKAWKAKQLHGPYNMWDLGDRPDKLLADIDFAEAKLQEIKLKNKGGPSQVDVAKNNSNKTAPIANGSKSIGPDAPPPVSVAAMSAKQRAQGLLDEARALQAQSQWVAAHTKALEARVAALEAQKAGLVFGAGEESPDLFLSAMASQAKSRIDALVRVADDNVAGADPARLKKAADSLAEARQLAMQFGLDVMPLDIKLSFVMQRQANPSAVMTASAQSPASGNMGLKLLEDARNEIKAGRLAQARRFAEEAFEPKYGVQKEAEMVLRSIDLETFEQNRLEADRAFIAANDAFQAQDFRRAQGILANIDDRLLSDRYRARLREIAMHPQMQPGQPNGPIKLAAAPINADGPGVANASDLPPQFTKASGDDFSGFKAMMAVEKDKLMKEGLVAQRSAMDKAKEGDLDGAIEILRGYIGNLGASGLDSEQQAILRKSADRYVQQYQTLKAQQKFQEEQRLAQGGSVAQTQKDNIIKQQQKEKEIVRLADQAAQLLRDHKYREAHVVYLKIQDLDPENPAAAAGLPIANIGVQEQRNKEIDTRKREFYLYDLDGDPGPHVNIEKPWAMNPGRFERAKNRTEYSTGITSQLKDPTERAIERALWEKKITFAFDNVPLDQCIKDVRQMAGINIVVDDYAMKTGGIHLDRPVTLAVNEISLQSALNHLLRNANLHYNIQNQSITITTEENAKGNRKMAVYPVPDLVIPVESKGSPMTALVNARWQAAINQQLNPGGYNAPTPYNPPGSLPQGTPVGSATGPGGAATLMGLPDKPTGQQSMDALLIRLITSTIQPDSWSDVGGKGTIQFYPLGHALVVNQTQDIQEQIVELLQALRRLQDLEVAIEMRLVSVSEAFFEFMGVNFSVNLPTGNSASAISTLLSGNFAPNGLPNKFSSPGFVSGLTPAGTLTPDLGVPIKPSSFGFALPPFGGYPGTLGADGGVSLGLAFLSDIQVAMFMEAAQGDRRTNVMQAPKITVFNGQTANINVGDQLTFLDSINVVQINGQTVFQPVQNPQPYGVFLTVTPVVSADRRFVRLNLNPTLQNLVSATVPLLPIQQLVPQLFYDGISPPQPQVFQMFFQQPSTSFISLNTTVVVPDGGTVLMGGLKTLVEGRNESGPPVLGKIPYIDRLFRNVGYGREAQSLMIMVTARIIINEEEELEFRGELPRIPR